MIDEVIRAYIHDSTIVNGREKVVLLLRQEGRKYDKYKLAHALISAKMYADAIDVNEELRLEANGEYLDFCKLNDVIIESKQTIEGYETVGLDLAKRTKVEDVALAGTEKKECFHAQNLLNMLFEGTLNLEEPFFDMSKSMTQFTEPENLFLEENSSLLIYPNPAKDYLTIELLLIEDEQAQVTILNMIGKQVLTNTITQTQSYIELSNLSAGTYFLQVTLPSGNQIFEKIVVKR